MKSTLVLSASAAFLWGNNIAAALKLDLTSDGMSKPISEYVLLKLDM
jgi:hypothetical protein